MASSEELRDAGPWKEGECPRCGSEDVRWKRSEARQALRCGGCKLVAKGRTDVEAERSFFEAHGKHRLRSHPGIAWEPFANSALKSPTDRAPRLDEGTLMKAYPDGTDPQTIWLKVSFGYKDGISSAQISDAALREKVLKLLDDSLDRPLKETLNWKVPD